MIRRWALFTTLAVVLSAGGGEVAWLATRPDHGDPDPGGAILAALRTVERAVPADARVMLRQAYKPRWDSCDARAGTFGWDDVIVVVQFRSGESAAAVLARADATLRAAGWGGAASLDSPLGPGESWVRTVEGGTTATASLTRATYGDPSEADWSLDAHAPPHGQRVSGC